MQHSVEYRDLARVCRTIAARARSRDSSIALLETADQYQRMAEALERGH